MKAKTKKKVAKKAAKKQPPQPRAPRPTKHEIVVRVEPQVAHIPTVSDLSEPMKDGKKLTIPKTWLSDGQVIRMVQATPPQHIYRRKGKGNQEFDYVTGSYVIKVLNFVFGWNWDFEVVSTEEKYGQVIVMGKLTVKDNNGNAITKTQSGRADIKYLTEIRNGKKVRTTNALDYGNDVKAATTDSLKKCASLLGIASDIYGKADYKTETGYEAREAQSRPVPIVNQLPPVAKPVVVTPNPQVPRECFNCAAIISEQEYAFSKKAYGKAYCRNCQRDLKPNSK